MLRAACGLALVLTVGCGGMVVFEEDGAGGSGTSSAASGASSSKGSTTSSSKSATASASTGGTCGALETALDQALAQVSSCNPALALEQCAGGIVILDKCACPTVAVNIHTPDWVIEAAFNAYDAWVGAGCGPLRCRACFPIQVGEYCEPIGNGMMGRCTGFGPD